MNETTTSNVPVDVFPLASVAVQVTIVVPIANIEPLGGVQVTVGDGSWLSVISDGG